MKNQTEIEQLEATRQELLASEMAALRDGDTVEADHADDILLKIERRLYMLLSAAGRPAAMYRCTKHGVRSQRPLAITKGKTNPVVTGYITGHYNDATGQYMAVPA